MPPVYRLSLISLLLSLGLSACHQPESAAKTEADVAEATAQGRARVDAAAATTVRDHIDNLTKAQGGPLPTAAARQDLNNVHHLASELAEANFRVAKERCDAETGDARSDCLKLAKLHYDAAIGEANSRLKAGEAALQSGPPQ
ncbi:hypothetical protein ED208_11150 [Stagnimonas aquatica]|uniref:DUF4398 domain-containing protein n=1 Tax=Stagnimonas aquatica TaxID=2689987 RepID=A0A3N0VAP0_9GAMM|nr:hypothetical protein [Stagnimonas aquatica]ROH89671.1 hypothetical protein ED208_11150 [Stagnimonas aquatica]